MPPHLRARAVFLFSCAAVFLYICSGQRLGYRAPIPEGVMPGRPEEREFDGTNLDGDESENLALRPNVDEMAKGELDGTVAASDQTSAPQDHDAVFGAANTPNDKHIENSITGNVNLKLTELETGPKSHLDLDTDHAGRLAKAWTSTSVERGREYEAMPFAPTMRQSRSGMEHAGIKQQMPSTTLIPREKVMSGLIMSNAFNCSNLDAQSTNWQYPSSMKMKHAVCALVFRREPDQRASIERVQLPRVRKACKTLVQYRAHHANMIKNAPDVEHSARAVLHDALATSCVAHIKLIRVLRIAHVPIIFQVLALNVLLAIRSCQIRRAACSGLH